MKLLIAILFLFTTVAVLTDTRPTKKTKFININEIK